jgi:hypothetical protein
VKASTVHHGGRHADKVTVKAQPDLGPPPKGAKARLRSHPHGARFGPKPKARAKLKRLLIPLGGKPQNTAGLGNTGWGGVNCGKYRPGDLEGR